MQLGLKRKLSLRLATSVSSCLAPSRTWTALGQLEPLRRSSAVSRPYSSNAVRRPITRAAKSPKPAERSPEVQQQVERSAAKLQALLQSVAQSSRVLKSAQGDELVQQAVAEVLPELDEGFLAIAAAYAKSAKDAGNEELADLINEVRSEVVRQVTRRLPVELQILNISTQISEREDRHNLLQQSMAGGVEGMIPACLPSSLWLTATQSITDMEEKESVPDRRLLAMLCLVREEVRELAARLPQEDPELGAAVQDRGRLLAPAALAFLQRLMAVPEPLQRKGLLTAAFRQEKAIDQDRSVKANQLMLAVNAVLAELESRAPIMDTQSGEMLYYGTEQEELEMSQRRLRLRSIRLEALQAISMSAGLSKASEEYQPLAPL